MKKFYLFLCVLIATFFCSEARASHIMGADITYTYIGTDASGNQKYLISLNFYRDCCSGCLVAGPSTTITITDSCNGSTFTRTLVPESCPNGCQVPTLCAGTQSSCDNLSSAYPGVMKYTDTCTITLPASCSKWTVAWTDGARNMSISNLQSPSSQNVYIEAVINNSTNPATGTPYSNSSVYFTKNPVPFACVNSAGVITYSNGAVDVNGDSLVYTLIDPLTAANSSIAHSGGYSAQQPITSSPPVTFNPQTGILGYRPSQTEVDVITFLVQEYRNGVLIGSVMRDVQLTIISCNLPAPPAAGPPVNLVNADTTSTSVKGCPGTPMSFDIAFVDPNGRNLTITSDLSSTPSPIPGAVFTQQGTGSAVVAHITYTPLPSDTGCHPFEINITTDDCPIPGTSVAAYTICVLTKVTVTPHNAIYCGTPIHLTATGGSNATWTPLAGLTFPGSIYTPLAAPSTNTMYIFQSDCGRDTARITYNPPFTMDAGPNGAICQNGQVQLNATVDNTYAPYQIVWTPATGLTDPLTHAATNSILNPVASPPSTTTYTVQFIANTGCIRTDTVKVTVNGFAPAIQANAYPTHLCPGDSTLLVVTSNPPCGPATTPCPDTTTYRVGLGTAVQGGTAFTYPSPYGNYYKSARHQFLIHASELYSQIGAGGTIKSMAMYIGTLNSGSTLSNFTVRIGCVDPSLDSLTAYVPESDLTTVSVTNYTPVNGWNNHQFTTPYNWDGHSNLVVDVCFTNTTSNNINNKMVYTVTPFRSVWFTYTNAPGGSCGFTGSQPIAVTNNNIFYQRPDFRFNVCVTHLSNASLQWTPNSGVNMPTPTNKDSVVAHPQSQQTYHVTLTDTNGCTSTDYVTVYVDTTVQLRVTPDTFICASRPVNLHATVTVASGSGVNLNNIHYRWYTRPSSAPSPPTGNGPGFANPQVTATGTTTYICEITGTGICTITDSAVVTLGNGLPVPKVVDSISCAGGSNGRITINMNAGTPAFTYLWSPAAPNSNVISNLAANTYYLTVTDAQGCVGRDTTTLTAPSPLALVLDSVNPNCFGSNTGTVTAHVTGGRGPYRYTWLPANNNTNALTGLAPGLYRLTVTDTSGCTIAGQVNIVQPTQLVSYVTTTNLSGVGTNDGTVKVHPSGGTAPYTFTWTPTVAGNTDTASGLAAGTYVVQICDVKGCCVKDTAIITVPPPINVVFTITNDSCFGACNGMVIASSSGGVAPYTYQWSTVPAQTSDTARGLCAGQYTVTVTDFNGISVSPSVPVNQPTAIAMAIDSTPITCFGANNGALRDSAWGGTPPYTYAWSPGGANPLSGLSPGNYNVLVTDLYHCTATGTAALGEPTLVTATILSTDSVKCFGDNNGRARVQAGGGRPGYTYVWSGSSSVVDSATDLLAGPHTVVVTDQSGCTASAAFNIYEPLQILVNVTPTAAHCATSNDGSATAAVTNGTPSYTYTWDGTLGTSSITGLSATSHTVVVADANGCSTTQPFNIDTIYVLHISLTADSVTCNGGADGVATVTVANGTPNFTYLWNPSTANTNPATSLNAGPQTVVVTDSYLCTATATITVPEPAPIVLTPGHQDPLCFNDVNGRIWIGATGGSGSYTFEFNSNGIQHPMTDTITGLASGTYSLLVTDSKNCTQNIVVALINPSHVGLSADVSDITCANANNGLIHVFGSGGTPGYTFTWSTGGANDTIRTNLPPDNYVITITDANNCTASLNVIMVAPPPISVLSLTADSANCPGASDGAITITVTGGTPGSITPYRYSLDLVNFQDANTFSDLKAGFYHVYAIDSQLCQLDTFINVYEPPAITLAIDPQDTTIIVGSSQLLTSLLGNVTTQHINGYSWTPADGLSCIDCPSPISTPFQTIEYGLTVNYGKNCFVDAHAVIHVQHAPDPYIPNAFSPNGNGTNDEFTVFGTGLKTVAMKVFNRWGEKVFDSGDSQWASWDGSYKGVGQPVGVYVYVVQLVYLDGVKKTKEGSVTLIR